MRLPVMKLPKWAVVFFVFFAVYLIAFPLPVLAQNKKNVADFENLAQKAWEQGTVRVIVHLDVPQIQELTAASTRFFGADTNQAVAMARISADAALRDAIDCSAQKVLLELQGMDCEVNAIYESIPYMALRASPYAIILLEASASVLGIEEDVYTKLIEPGVDEGKAKDEKELTAGDGLDDPFLNTSTNLIGATAAWSMGYTGAGWYVAILDTGIRKTHQFFTGKSIIEACFARGRDGNAGAGDCPNGLAIMKGPGAAVHYPSSYEGYDHGTHVSGIATGKFGTLAGVAKDAGIIAVKVFSKFTASDCGGSPCVRSWNSDCLAGLDYVYSIRGIYKIAAVNMSLGGGKYSSSCDSDSRKTAIDNLRTAGIATAIATGNEGYCNYIGAPACISSSVAVGSSTKSDGESSFNNWHATMQKLFAPGSSIYSSTGDSNSSYASWNGTSMATPHVAGAWALMKQANPGGSVTSLLNALQATGVAMTSVCNSRSTVMPRIRVDKAIASFSSKFNLTIQNGTGGTTSPAAGVHSYAKDSTASVTALPSAGYRFLSWSGDASGTANPVSVLMDRDKSIKANFLRQYVLTISSGAGGTSSPVPGSYKYDTGTAVQLTAIPSANYRFLSWSGDASGTANPLSVVMNANKSIKANFVRQYVLTITAGAGGTTSPVPGPHKYDSGSYAQVTAKPTTYYYFKNWGGASAGSVNPVSILMNGDKSLLAFFRLIYAPSSSSGQKVLNRSLSQSEYINILSWAANPNNENIASYKIYLVEGGVKTEVATLDANTFTWRQRNVGKSKQYTYQIVAVNSGARAGMPATVVIQ